jgi:hypothetical protein
MTGDDGWSWDKLVPYMKKVLQPSCTIWSARLIAIQNEHFVLPSDFHNATKEFNPAVHGFTGINSVTLHNFATPIDSRIIKTTTELAEYPFNLDMNSGYHLGIGTPSRTANGHY